MILFNFYQDIQRPLYLTAHAAVEYGIVDKIIDKSAKAIDEVLNTESWDKAAGLVKCAVLVLDLAFTLLEF